MGGTDSVRSAVDGTGCVWLLARSKSDPQSHSQPRAPECSSISIAVVVADLHSQGLAVPVTLPVSSSTVHVPREHCRTVLCCERGLCQSQLLETTAAAHLRYVALEVHLR